MPVKLFCFFLLASVGGGSAAKSCPSGCQCSKGKGGGDCGVRAECKGWKAFPKAEGYPKNLDCLFVQSPALGKLSAKEKEDGLQAIPATIRRLDLSECRLRELPESGLGHLQELRVLNLEFNELEVLPEKTFHGLSKLKVLWLTGNHYNKDEPEYAKMKRAGNNLKELHVEQFKTLLGLQVLLLHHNKLQWWPDKIFEDQAKLRVVKLLDNKFSPRLTRQHPAFKKLRASKVLRQLDLKSDSGDVLEDDWEETGSYLSDEFYSGTLPLPRDEF